MKIVMATVVGVLGLGAVAHASITPITNDDVSNFADLGVSTQLNLTGVVTGIGGAGSNTFVSTFNSADNGGLGFVQGTLTSEVFGNVAAPGGSLTDVVIKYTLTNSGFDQIDEFDFGVNTNTNLDANDLTKPQTSQGRINGESNSLFTPNVFVDTTSSNTLWTFDFEAALGVLASGETLTWYVKTDGEVAIQLVDVTVKNAEDAEAQALSFVDPNAGQPDLGVPAPGALALMGLAGLAATRRRRA